MNEENSKNVTLDSIETPEGWFPVETHNDSKIILEFMGRGENGETLWERPVKETDARYQDLLENYCPHVSDRGLPCKRRLYDANNGEFWDHAGGHFFAPREKWYITSDPKIHLDAVAFLSGELAEYHHEKDCDYTGSCAWRTRPKSW